MARAFFERFLNPMSEDRIFETSLDYPDPDARRRYESLVGLEEQKQRLEKGLRAILNPLGLRLWTEKFYSSPLPIVELIQKRPPLFVLTGDVGTGKTALAESIADRIARVERIDITLFRLSLSSRGSGLVGEMTKIMSAAFGQFCEKASKLRSNREDKARAGCLLLIDEADALAQSRETTQMHHEDRAGVNALIRGIDELSLQRAPAAVLMCTNRIGAIDPAVRRRAADVIEFYRPQEPQRQKLLEKGLSGLGFSKQEIEKLAGITGDRGQGAFTCADLTDRYLPNLVLHCYPDQKITFDAAYTLLNEMAATPSFRDEQGVQ